MTVLIKKAGADEYYSETGSWTTHRDKAKVFPHTIDAMKECAAKKLQSTIVLAFLDSRYDLKIPCDRLQ